MQYIGGTLKIFVDYEQWKIDLQTFLVFSQHPVWFVKPMNR